MSIIVIVVADTDLSTPAELLTIYKLWERPVIVFSFLPAAEFRAPTKSF